MSEIKKIFRIFLKENSIKVNLILFDGPNKMKIFAWFPFDNENNCSKRIQTAKLIGECFSDIDQTNGNEIIKTEYSDVPKIPQKLNMCHHIHHIEFAMMNRYVIMELKFVYFKVFRNHWISNWNWTLSTKLIFQHTIIYFKGTIFINYWIYTFTYIRKMY